MQELQLSQIKDYLQVGEPAKIYVIPYPSWGSAD